MKSRIATWSIAATWSVVLVGATCVAAQDNPTPDHKHKHQKYRLIDLGTFGGPWSAVVNANSSGTATGVSTTATLISDPNLYNCLPPYVTHGFTTRNGQAIDLGTLAGEDRCSVPQMISDGGDIVGISEVNTIDPIFGFHEMRAVRWRNGQIQNLGTLGGRESAAQSTNSRGQIVGFAVNSTPDPYSFLDFLALGSPDGTQTRGFLWQGGLMHDLGTLGGPDANAVDINDRGQVTGFSYTNSIPNPTTGIPTIDPFVWDRSRMVDVGTLGGTIGSPSHINQRGQVIGTSNLAGDLTSHPFLWDRGVLTDMGTLGGDNGEPENINEAGVVVGKADLPGSQVHDAFLWHRGVMTDLGTLPGYPCSRANSVNAQRQIVGNVSFCENAHHAVLWDRDGALVDLNSLIPPNSSLELSNALDINDRGEIAGNGVPAGCQPEDAEACGHAYLLIPDGDCDDACEQRITDSRRVDLAPRASFKPQTPMSPAERARSLIRQRFGLPGAHPTLRD